MTERHPAQGWRTRIGVAVATGMAAVGVCFTLLLFAVAIYVGRTFAADHELDGSTWPTVAWIVVLGVISGLATASLGRRVLRQLR